MKTVRAKDAAVMIASGKAKKGDFEKVGEPGIYRVTDVVAQRLFGTPATTGYDIFGHNDRKARFGA